LRNSQAAPFWQQKGGAEIGDRVWLGWIGVLAAGLVAARPSIT
jgi:hypothetical protein